MSESARCNGGGEQCWCTLTRPELTSESGAFLMRDGEGNVVKDYKGRLLCECGHLVSWHPPGSASQQTQVTGNQENVFEAFFQKCEAALTKEPDNRAMAEHRRYMKIGRSLMEQQVVTNLIDCIRKDKRLIGGNVATCHENKAFINNAEKTTIVTSTFPPFYFVEGHSGAGKTQLPFAIEGRGIPIVHLVLTRVCDDSQLIYKAFKEKSDFFQKAVMKDLSEGLKETSDLSVDGLSSYDDHGLYTVVFILHELKVHGFDVEGVAPNPQALGEFIKQQVRARRAHKLPVFVLDEALTSRIASDDSEALRQFRFARNIFRAVGLVVILMGTNSKAANFTNYSSQSRSEGGMRVWCRLITQLPRITEQSMEVLVGVNALRSLPKKHASLKRFLESQCLVNTPWFVQLMLEALAEIEKEHTIAAMNSCDLMDLMFKHVAASVWEKKKNDKFLCGQFAMHLAWHKKHDNNNNEGTKPYTSSFAVDENCFISHHFGKPWHEDIDLHLRGRRAAFMSSSASGEINPSLYYPKTVHNNEQTITNFVKYESLSYFAGAEKECFMYLSLGGGNMALLFPNAFRDENDRFSTEQARKLINSHQIGHGNTLMDGNTNAKSRSGDRLESLAGVAMEVASHEHGMSGGPLESFLGLVAAELLQEYPSRWTWRDGAGPRDYLSSGLLKMIVPYLSSANDRWPDAIHLIPGCKFGNLIRSENENRIDFAVETREGNITGEAKNHENAVNAETMRKLLDRVPPSSQVHIVFASTVQEKYFTRDGTWEKFKSKATHLQNTTFVKVEATRGEERTSVELSLEPMFKEKTSRRNWNNRLVIFYPIEDMQRELHESLEVLNSDPQQLESSTGKRTRATSNALIKAMPARKVKKRK